MEGLRAGFNLRILDDGLLGTTFNAETTWQQVYGQDGDDFEGLREYGHLNRDTLRASRNCLLQKDPCGIAVRVLVLQGRLPG
jgi:hypothetical protein